MKRFFDKHRIYTGSYLKHVFEETKEESGVKNRAQVSRKVSFNTAAFYGITSCSPTRRKLSTMVKWINAIYEPLNLYIKVGDKHTAIKLQAYQKTSKHTALASPGITPLLCDIFGLNPRELSEKLGSFPIDEKELFELRFGRDCYVITLKRALIKLADGKPVSFGFSAEGFEFPLFNSKEL